MTKEEALEQLRIGPGINEDVSEEYNNAVDMAVKSLEQEPCEDTVSRKEVFETFGELLGIWGRKALMELPSVTPTRKVGEWIVLRDEYGDIVEAVCSCCDVPGHHKWRFCPHCGAEMESEE